jgi:hypothetical protein
MKRIFVHPTPSQQGLCRPRRRHPLLRSLRTWCLLGVLIPGAVHAAGSAEGDTGATKGIDAVLIMDSSGSMLKNDPKKLRVPAAKLFMSLLGEQDRVGLISFSDAGYPVLRLTHLQGPMQQKALAAADRVSSKGIYTNLHAALRKGKEMLDREGQPGRDPMLILMSDGRMDVGDAFEDHQLSQQVEQEVVAELQAAGIKVYTIAFTEASDLELLELIAEQTDGLFRLARTDRDLHEVFSTIFESAKSPDMLPMEGGEFVVDGSIEEVTIVASKERSDVRIFLESPDGERLSSGDASEDLKWFVSHHFDMITLRSPGEGRWKLLFSAGNNRAYIVTNMALNTNLRGGDVEAGSSTTVEGWLEKEGERLTAEAVLTNTEFLVEITEPDGASARFDLFDLGEYGDRQAADGIYSNLLTFQKGGEHQLKVIARSETFERSKSAYFRVAVPPAPVQPDPAPQPEPAPKPEPETLTQSAPEPQPQSQPEPAAEPEPAPAEEPGLAMVLGIFLAINLVLALMGVGVWWFLSRRKRRQELAALDDEAEELEEPGLA